MIFLIFLPIIISALTYNDPCQNKCDLPGLVCQNNRCQCDGRLRLFWTGARCFSCPNTWTLSETACIAYYHTKVTWDVARSTCRGFKAELISFRRPDIVQLLYTLQYRIDRKKRDVTYADAKGGWTSARVQDFQNAIYRWLDPATSSFNRQSSWWCKNTTNLGYTYRYNEPTRWTVNGENEACVVYWRGEKNTPVVCLDDQLCSKQFEFVCELSESTAKQYHGPPPVVTVTSSGQVTVTNNVAMSQLTGNNNQLKPVVSAKTESKKSSTTITIIAIVAALLILLGLLLGAYCCFIRNRKDMNIRNSKATISASHASDVSSIAPSIMPKPIKGPAPVTQPVSAPPDLNLQKQKNQRGGFSKQQFDEFD